MLLGFSVHNPCFAFGWLCVEDVESGGASPGSGELAWTCNVPHVVDVVLGVIDYVGFGVAHDVEEVEW